MLELLDLPVLMRRAQCRDLANGFYCFGFTDLGFTNLEFTDLGFTDFGFTDLEFTDLEDKLARCGICIVHVHTSNGYTCNVIIPPCCIIRNYSPQCHAKIIGLEDVPSLKAIKFDPHSDDAFVDMFVEHQRFRGRKWLWFKQEACFLKYDGTLYKRMDKEDIGQDIISDCSDLVTKLAIAFAQSKKQDALC